MAVATSLPETTPRTTNSTDRQLATHVLFLYLYDPQKYCSSVVNMMLLSWFRYIIIVPQTAQEKGVGLHS